MADFYQTGVVATLHRFMETGHERLERELMAYASQRPVALVLPALFSEFEGPAMPRIVEQLREVPYLRQVILTLAKADEEKFALAKKHMSGIPAEVRVIWNDGPRIEALYTRLRQNDLPVGEDGKGRSCWLAYGYVLASRKSDVIALHDCDIATYDREMLARLVYPVANPNINFEFCKGFYARVTERMHGRVTRLFMTPLVQAMQDMAPEATFLKFLGDFRYPLAGEFAMKVALARVNRIPGDWGLEVGVLAEVYRNCALARVCQVDLADNYEHKHQDLSAGDRTRGLRRMALDVAKSLFRTIAGEGVVFTRDHFRTLEVRYVRLAEDTISRYYADAMLNGLKFDRHAEEQAVAAFVQSLREAAEEFTAEPLGSTLIPNWNRVVAAIPEFFGLLLDAVAADNRRQRLAAA